MVCLVSITDLCKRGVDVVQARGMLGLRTSSSSSSSSNLLRREMGAIVGEVAGVLPSSSSSARSSVPVDADVHLEERARSGGGHDVPHFPGAMV